MTADLLSHSRRGRTCAHCPLIKLEPCALAVITWGVPLHVRVQCTQAWSMDVLERRCRSVVVVPTPLALGVALYTTADVAAQVRRCAQLQTRAHGALASHLSLHCASRGKGAARAACWRACTASTCVATHGPALDPASMMTLRAAARSRSPRCVSSRLPLHNVGRRPCAVCDCVAVGLGGWSRGLCTRYSRMNVCVAVGARPLFASVCIAFSNAKSMSAASTSWRRPTCHAYY